MICVSETPIDSSAALKAFEEEIAQSDTSGAIISFSGRVRGNAASGQVSFLKLQSYPSMTEKGIAEACQKAQQTWPLDGVHIRHRIGEMQAGDTIVFVATASAHRRAAFEAADFLMDYLKTKAVFWKQEATPAGATWIEPRAEDYSDAARWKLKAGTHVET